MTKTKTFRAPPSTVAVFAYGGVHPETLTCLIRDFARWPGLGYACAGDDALIDRSRSRIASRFLEADPKRAGDVLLMVDHDIKWDDGNLQYLAWACEKKKGIVGGVYSKRNFGQGPAVRFKESGHFQMGSPEIVEVEYASTGFMAIHRRVLEKLSQTMPMTIGRFWPFFIPMLDGEGRVEELSEDWAFCKRAKDAGFGIYAALGPRLTHYGQWGYRVLDSVMPAAPDVDVPIYIRGENKHPLIDGLGQDVPEFLGIAEDTLDASFTYGTRELAKLWNNPKNELDWYKRQDVGEAYILDLAAWHMNQIPEVIEASTAGIEGKRVLDYGSGIGTWALMLSANGNQVDCVEPNDRLWEFTKYRAQKLGTNSLHRTDSVTSGDYDVAIAWHVLEHVEHPETIAATIASGVKEGGHLLTESDFHSDLMHPMHHTRDDNGDSIWEGLGFEHETGPWWRKAAGR